MGNNSPSSSSDDLWAKIEPPLPKPVKTHPPGGGRKRVCYRKVMNGIPFALRTGCQWEALDATGICSGSTAHARFQEWEEAGVFLGFWKQGLLAYDELHGLDWKWQAMDGAMTKAPWEGKKTGHNPTDRGKLGVKRSVLCEGRGLPTGPAVEGANRHDMKLTEATLASIPVDRPKPGPYRRQHLCLDKGYDFDEVRDLVDAFGYTAHIRSRGEEAKALRKDARKKARRWVAERTHSWLNRFRPILCPLGEENEQLRGSASLRLRPHRIPMHRHRCLIFG